MITDSKPWYGDVATHPLSPLQSQYGGARLNNHYNPCCPYCACSLERGTMGPESIFDLSATCDECGAKYVYDFDTFFGFNSRPILCSDRHMYMYCYTEDSGDKTHKCVMCEHVFKSSSEQSLNTLITDAEVCSRMKRIRS